jgi:hypothetical protein
VRAPHSAPVVAVPKPAAVVQHTPLVAKPIPKPPVAASSAPVPPTPAIVHQAAKPISLSQLKSKTTPDSQTGPLKENISALRQALASAMKKDPKDMVEARGAGTVGVARPLPPQPQSVPSSPRASQSTVSSSVSVSPIKKEPQSIPEIPENELRRLLEVEK